MIDLLMTIKRNLFQILFQIFNAESAEFAELFAGDELVVLFAQSFFDDAQDALGVAWTASGDDLDILGIDDNPTVFHSWQIRFEKPLDILL